MLRSSECVVIDQISDDRRIRDDDENFFEYSIPVCGHELQELFSAAVVGAQKISAETLYCGGGLVSTCLC